MGTTGSRLTTPSDTLEPISIVSWPVNPRSVALGGLGEQFGLSVPSRFRRLPRVGMASAITEFMDSWKKLLQSRIEPRFLLRVDSLVPDGDHFSVPQWSFAARIQQAIASDTSGLERNFLALRR
jgi:hypothetical protein